MLMVSACVGITRRDHLSETIHDDCRMSPKSLMDVKPIEWEHSNALFILGWDVMRHQAGIATLDTDSPS